MAELADALDSGSSEHYAHRGSSPLPRTITEPTVDTIIDCRFVVFLLKKQCRSKAFRIQPAPPEKNCAENGKILAIVGLLSAEKWLFYVVKNPVSLDAYVYGCILKY